MSPAGATEEGQAWSQDTQAETQKSHFPLLLHAFFHRTGEGQSIHLFTVTPSPLPSLLSPGNEFCKTGQLSSYSLPTPAPGCTPIPPSKSRLHLRVLPCLALCSGIKAQTSWGTRGLCVISLKLGPPFLFPNSSLGRAGIMRMSQWRGPYHWVPLLKNNSS